MDDGRPRATAHRQLPIPSDWPERRAYEAGHRLFEAGEDTVPTLIRLGSDITGYLTADEIGALLELGAATFERWERLGWSDAELFEELR